MYKRQVNNIPKLFLEQNFDKIINFAHLKEEQFNRVKSLSSGQRQRLGISVFIHTPREIMVMDEPMVAIDSAFQEQCSKVLEEYSQSKRKTLIMVDHNINVLARFCKKAIWLDKGVIKETGDFNEVRHHYEQHCDSLANKNATLMNMQK